MPLQLQAPTALPGLGFSLHAATCVEASDRARLERLCRYVIRPPLAAGRLQILDVEQRQVPPVLSSAYTA